MIGFSHPEWFTIQILYFLSIFNNQLGVQSQDYGKFRLNANPFPLVMGGRIVNPLNFPWHAAIFMSSTHNYQCGGTLITANVVLTAAHCTYKSTDSASIPFQPYELEVILAPVSGIYGDNNLPRTQKLLISEIIPHNYYQGARNNYRNDVALLRLSYPAQLNNYVLPAQLPSRNDAISNNMLMQVNGYGTTSPDVSQMKASRQFYGTSVIPNSPQCQNDPQVTSTIDLQSQICTTSIDPGSGTCLGDSGGGLFKREANDYWSIQGLVSFGYSSFPDPSRGACSSMVIFTRVQFFLPWIFYNTATTSSANDLLRPSPSASGVFRSDSANQVALSLHNNYRRRHGSPPLQLDYSLISAAQEYANYLVSQNYRVGPKPGAPYGQNTFEVTGASFPTDEAVQKAVSSWYNGNFEYFWSAPLSSTYNGFSFSQVVWKSSTRLGVGVASQKDRSIVIAFYSPPGNVADLQSFQTNVFPG